MKRFVDIRGQGTGLRFSWFCTVTGKIENFDGENAWDTFDEFEEDLRIEFNDRELKFIEQKLERYKGLAADWCFEENPEEPIWHGDEPLVFNPAIHSSPEDLNPFTQYLANYPKTEVVLRDGSRAKPRLVKDLDDKLGFRDKKRPDLYWFLDGTSPLGNRYDIHLLYRGD